MVTCYDLMHSIDESLLIIGDEADEATRLLVVQQHQHFDVALSVVAEMDAAGEARFHDVVKGFEGGLIVFRELKLYGSRFRNEWAERREQLKIA